MGVGIRVRQRMRYVMNFGGDEWCGELCEAGWGKECKGYGKGKFKGKGAGGGTEGVKVPEMK